MRFKAPCPHITAEVLATLHKSMRPGEEVTDSKWNVAYTSVWTDHAVDTIIWKINNIHPKFLEETK